MIETCPGCGKRRNPNRPTCLPCWRDLPPRVRAFLTASWRTAAGADERIRAQARLADWYAEHLGHDRVAP